MIHKPKLNLINNFYWRHMTWNVIEIR